MELIETNNIKEFEDFVLNHPTKSHFLQSSLWGEFCFKEKNLIPHYLCLKDGNKILCATMLLEKKLPLNYSYFYAPRGFVIDFNDLKLLEIFTIKISEYVKKKKGIFFKIDPDFIISKKNYLDENINLPYDYQKVFNKLIELGYKHKGFTKRFELSEPRYSFRIDFNQSFSDIENHFSKTTKQRIKKAEELGIEVTTTDNIDEFFELTKITEHRKNFITHPKKYYEVLKNIFKDNSKIFLGIVYLDKIINNLNDKSKIIKNELNDLCIIENKSKSINNKIKELERQYNKISSDLNIYSKYKKEYGNKIVLSAHFIVSYGDKAWVLYAGNHDILSNTYANYKTYLEHIKYYYENGYKIYDQFGTVGEIGQNDPLKGLHEFKKKFGGDYIEFIGEFDFITNKSMYFLFNKLVPIYRKIQFKKNKKSNKKDI